MNDMEDRSQSAYSPFDIAVRAVMGVIILAGVLAYLYSGSGKKKSSPPPPTCDRSEAWFYAQEAVEGVLKNPDEADFHNPYGWMVENDPDHAGQYFVFGEVTATNSFNAKIKSKFKAVVRCADGTWYLGKVTME